MSNHDSPLLLEVKPTAETLGAEVPTAIGPILTKPVLGEAVLSAKKSPG